MTLIFLQTKESPEHGLVNEELAAVTMSPPQFKLLAQLCATLATGYEQTVGPISLPEGTGNPNLNPDFIVKSIRAAREAAAQTEGAKQVESVENVGHSVQRTFKKSGKSSVKRRAKSRFK